MPPGALWGLGQIAIYSRLWRRKARTSTGQRAATTVFSGGGGRKLGMSERVHQRQEGAGREKDGVEL